MVILTTITPPVKTVRAEVIYSETQLDSILRIMCKKDANKDEIDSTGTAFIIEQDRVITAHHVIAGMEKCYIQDTPLVLVESNQELDYAVFSVPTGELTPLPYRCGGFARGKTYYALGYARGLRFSMNRLVASHRYEETSYDMFGNIIGTHLRELRGVGVPGMSGGPVLDEDGYVVGTTVSISLNGLPRVYSRELRELPVCQK